MSIDQYFGVNHQGVWKIKHNGKYSKTYKTQKAAIGDAIKRAVASEGGGRNSQVLAQNEHHTFRTEWTYGKDPYPPREGDGGDVLRTLREWLRWMTGRKD